MNADPVSATAVQDVDGLLAPPYAARVAQQLFTHSAHAPVTLLILEWLLAGSGYFAKPDGYILIGTAVAQACWLAHANRRHTRWIVAGNLLGVACYSLLESMLEGARFFTEAQHLAYWAIAAAFAVLQGLRHHFDARPNLRHGLLLLENIARAAIPVLLYAVYEARFAHTPLNLEKFFHDSAHVYLTIVVLLLGILLGFADITLRRMQRALRGLAKRLHELSSWGFGSHVVAAALHDVKQVMLQRQERAMLFMDIRGFTAWSERQSPEAVVGMLNDYYAASEGVLLAFPPIKLKFTADEVMAVFADKQQAFRAALQLQLTAMQVLAPFGLSVGLGLHAGPVVEGLLGSAGVKAFEVIGDAVNTASRLCSAAMPGELLVSETVNPGVALSRFPLRHIEAKGKREPIAVRVLSRA